MTYLINFMKEFNFKKENTFTKCNKKIITFPIITFLCSKCGIKFCIV